MGESSVISDFVMPFFSLCRALSDVPVTKVIGAVRIGMVNGEFIVNPTVQELKSSRLDMVMAGSEDSVIMIEVRKNPVNA